jgi:DNA-binding helix-hairpin-helix protein with protein kinase domain
MTLRGLNNEQYITARELGRGGEGTVYELSSHPALVLKQYNDLLTDEKVAKLRQMAAMTSKEIASYAAWPVDLVFDEYGKTCGFVMKKLSGYVPLHMIFSPLDRKKMFPDKGYNFLVHVARNLATAFHKIHEAGLIVGDVNEGNILVNSAGLIAFIDCDSFQVKSPFGYFFCEVGVPRYTPPELLKHGSFEQVARTVNTDSFSLAVLVFQLLFLGRHPFAGKHRSAADLDEETAIRQRQFAYSLENKKKKLSPPNDSLSITSLDDDIVSLFHLAFEQDSRPTPADWTKVLDHQLSDMVTCAMSRLHTYPSKLAECPWCQFRQNRGILYFLDDSYLHAQAVLGDIESFVNGFRLEKLELKKWNGQLIFPNLTARPIEKKFFRYKSVKLWGSLFVVVLGYALFNVSLSLLILCLLLIPFIYRFAPWAHKIRAEETRRRNEFNRLHKQLDKLIADYDHPTDLDVYNKQLVLLQKHVHDFRRLPDELERRKKVMEEEVYNEQLDNFLRRFYIDEHTIPSFGPAKKTTLLSHGIRTAADVLRLQHLRVPGIGPANIEILRSWRRQMANEFVYIPNDYEIRTKMQTVNSDMSRIKANLETAIRKEYQSLNYIKLNISNRSSILERQISDLAAMTYQAEVDMLEFTRRM